MFWLVTAVTAGPEIVNISNLSAGLGQQEGGLGQGQGQDRRQQVALPLSGGESPPLLQPEDSQESQEQLPLLLLQESQLLGA